MKKDHRLSGKVKSDLVKGIFGISPCKENKCILRISDKELRDLALRDAEIAASTEKRMCALKLLHCRKKWRNLKLRIFV